MPSLAGLTLTAAAARAASAGLHIASAEDLNLSSTSEAAPLTPQSPPSATTPSFTEPIAHTVSSIGTVIAQTPAAGHRVVKGDPVHITLTN
jgi:beta-lactam-binding protein with PASTA domain